MQCRDSPVTSCIAGGREADDCHRGPGSGGGGPGGTGCGGGVLCQSLGVAAWDSLLGFRRRLLPRRRSRGSRSRRSGSGRRSRLRLGRDGFGGRSRQDGRRRGLLQGHLCRYARLRSKDPLVLVDELPQASDLGRFV